MTEPVTENATLPWLEDDSHHTEEHVTSVEHHPKKAGMPQLDPTWFASQLFWLFICFTLLYIIMARAIVPRIREVLETRQNRINSDLEFARSMQEEAEAVKQEYEVSLEEAKMKVRERIQEVQKANEVEAIKASEVMDQEIHSLTEASETEIQAQAKQAEKELSPLVEELSSLIVEKVALQKPDSEAIEAHTKTALKSFSLTKAA